MPQLSISFLKSHSRILLEKLTDFQVVKKFPAFYGTRSFITRLKPPPRPTVPILSQLDPVHAPPPHPTSWRSVLTLSSYLSLGLPRGLFPSGFPTKTLYTPLLSLIRATCSTHLTLLDLITTASYNNVCSSLGEGFNTSLVNFRMLKSVTINRENAYNVW